MRRRSGIKALLAIGATIVGIVAGTPIGAYAATNPYERGPAPTRASLEAANGPFVIGQTTVPASADPGFGGATIYYPTDRTQGTFGGIAVAPGFLGPGSSLSAISKRVASHGFVLILIDTLSRTDRPPARADQLKAALNYLTRTSTVRDRVDATRLGVMGHSMGGGGAIEASAEFVPPLSASVALTPWHSTTNWSGVRVPTLIVGAESDTTAPPAEHAEPFYESMTSAPEKAYLELAGADHRVPIHLDVDPTLGLYSVAWFKRFVDRDTRYDQFLCPGPASGGPILEYRDTCPTGVLSAAR
jgi:dienelactone hydrolase